MHGSRFISRVLKLLRLNIIYAIAYIAAVLICWTSLPLVNSSYLALWKLLELPGCCF